MCFFLGHGHLRLVQSKLSLTYFRTTTILCQTYTHTHTQITHPNIARLRSASQTQWHTPIIPDRQKAEAGQSQVQGQPELYSEFNVSILAQEKNIKF